MLNAWYIDYDVLEGKVVNVRGPAYEAGMHYPIQFQLLDDDGVIYYYGRMQDLKFDPLDDYGAPSSGCTELKYMDPNDCGRWISL